MAEPDKRFGGPASFQCIPNSFRNRGG